MFYKPKQIIFLSKAQDIGYNQIIRVWIKMLLPKDSVFAFGISMCEKIAHDEVVIC